MKFKIIKHFSLADLGGDEWKDAYLDFTPLTIADMKNKLPEIAKLKTEKSEDNGDFDKGIDTIVSLLQEKFISGKAIGESGTLEDVTKEDIGNLPVEVIGRAFTFLSQLNLENSQ